MTDKKIINFEKMQEKWNQQELEKYGKYLDTQIEKAFLGKISMIELAQNMKKYQDEHHITEDMVVQFQKNIIKKSGLDIDLEEVEKQVEEFSEMYRKDTEYLKKVKQRSFFKKHDKKMEYARVARMNLVTEKNNLSMIIDGKQVIIYSKGRVDFSDKELNEILKEYRTCFNSDLEIVTCESVNTYEYHER